MPVYWLNEHELSFPHPAMAEPSGLLAVGGDLSPDRLVLAYRNGIFPWFEADGNFYWYSPDPRFVLFPEELKVHKSMRSVFNQGKFEYSLDTCFEQVIRTCAESPRNAQDGSWISEAFIEGYTELHRQGVAHSVEVWNAGKLVGGLYGISLGRIFWRKYVCPSRQCLQGGLHYPGAGIAGCGILDGRLPAANTAPAKFGRPKYSPGTIFGLPR